MREIFNSIYKQIGIDFENVLQMYQIRLQPQKNHHRNTI